ncbi:hypothetical protein ES703_116886 [subsurface metagenome]
MDWFSKRVHTQFWLAEMGKVHAIVLEPGWVEDAMAINRNQIFSPFTVDM